MYSPAHTSSLHNLLSHTPPPTIPPSTITTPSPPQAVQAKDFDEFATEAEVSDAIDAVATGLQKEIFADTDAKSSATNARVDELIKDLAGFDVHQRSTRAAPRGSLHEGFALQTPRGR